MAQIIGIVSLPFITRLYGPEVFGMLNLFMIFVTIVASVATLSYANSIVLPKSDIVAYQLLKISLVIASVVCIFSGLLIVLFKGFIVELFHVEDIENYLGLTPIGAFLLAVVQSFEQWSIRNKQFKTIAIAGISKAGFMGLSRTSAGVFIPSVKILIILTLVAQIVQITILYLIAKRDIKGVGKLRSSSKHKAAQYGVAYKYRDFPRYRAPQAFINSISHAMPLLVLASIFDPALAGFYALARSVLNMPVSLISQSIGKVFLQKMSSATHTELPIKPMIMKATYGLALLGVMPFSIVMFMGPWLFGFVFGIEWTEAGEYARWITVWAFFYFINAPSVQSLALTNSQGILLVWEVITTGIKLILILVVGIMTKDAVLTVAVFSIFSAFSYCILIYIGIMRAGKYDRSKNF